MSSPGKRKKKDSSRYSLATRHDNTLKNDEAIIEKILAEPERREKAVAIFERHTLLHIGPLPDPDTLERYSNIIPNGAERIMCMAEEQSTHRRAIEKKAIDSREKQNIRGQMFAFILALFFGLIGLALALLGHTKAAIAAFSLPIATIIVAFIRGKGKQH